MSEQQRFRILTPDGLLSRDAFVAAPQQPKSIKTGCALVINVRSGMPLTVHASRLLPEEPAEATTRRSVCLKCGKVEGVVGDQVVCPRRHDSPCGLLQRRTKTKTSAASKK